jgi:hypothetical protein
MPSHMQDTFSEDLVKVPQQCQVHQHHSIMDKKHKETSQDNLSHSSQLLMVIMVLMQQPRRLFLNLKHTHGKIQMDTMHQVNHQSQHPQ